MSGEQLYFIRVPRLQRFGGKTEMDFISVDPTKLHPGIVTELFVRVMDRTARSSQVRYLPVVGVEHVVPRSPDVSELIETIERIGELWKSALTAHGAEGESVWEKYVRDLPFAPLVSTLAKGHLGQANEALEQILYGLLSLTSTLASRITEETTTASRMTETVDSVVETITRREELTNDMLLDWSSEAEALNRAVDELRSISSWAQDLQLLIRSERDALLHLLETSPAVSAAHTFFEGGGDDPGFLVRAYQSRSSGGELRGEVAVARQHLDACRECTRCSGDRWSKLERHRGELLQRHRTVDELVARIRKSSSVMRDYQRRFGPNTARPYHIDNGSIISRGEFERAERSLLDPGLAPEVCREQAASILLAALDLLNDEPRLPPELQEALDQAEKLIGVLETESPEQDQTQGVVAPVVRQTTGAERPSPSGVDAARVEELYRLVIAVGYVLTCNHYNFAQSNIRAMLDVVRHLGRCTSAEFDACLEAVQDRSKLDGERVRVPEGFSFTKLWRSTHCRWVQYRVKGRWALKLAELQGKGARALLDELHLAEADVRKAHEARRAERQQAWEDRKSTD